jgi:DNA-binding Lrp family transcriptional regulator
MLDLDQIDLKLLELLQQSAKLTTKEIAQQVNLSSTPCMKERRMEKRHQEICGRGSRKS